MSNQKQCDRCGLLWEPERSDEEAMEEYRQNAPFLNERLGTPPPGDGLACLCDDCYEEFMSWAAKQPVKKK